MQRRDLGRRKRVTAVECVTSMAIGYATPIISVVQFCVFLQRLSARISAVFHTDFLNASHRHSLDCGVVGPPSKHY